MSLLKYVLYFFFFQKCTLACMDPGRTLNVYALRPEASLGVPCRVPFKDLSIIICCNFLFNGNLKSWGEKTVSKS